MGVHRSEMIESFAMAVSLTTPSHFSISLRHSPFPFAVNSVPLNFLLFEFYTPPSRMFRGRTKSYTPAYHLTPHAQTSEKCGTRSRSRLTFPFSKPRMLLPPLHPLDMGSPTS